MVLGQEWICDNRYKLNLVDMKVYLVDTAGRNHMYAPSRAIQPGLIGYCVYTKLSEILDSSGMLFSQLLRT